MKSNPENAQVQTQEAQLQVATPSALTVTESAGLDTDPITGLKWKSGNWQSFSWAWVWLSLGSFVMTQMLLANVITRMATMHGTLLLEALMNVVTYYGGGLIIGAASPKVRVTEPAVAAVLSLFLVMTVGMWTPFSFMSLNLVKTLVMSVFVFCLAWSGAVHGEKLTRQL